MAKDAPTAARSSLKLWIIGGVAVVIVALLGIAGVGAAIFAMSGIGGGVGPSPTSASASALAPTTQPNAGAAATVSAGQIAPTASVAPPRATSTLQPAAPPAAPSATAAAPKTPTTAPKTPTVDAALQREQAALAVPAGFKKYQSSSGDFALNIPSDWQSLAADAKGKQVVLGNQTTRNTIVFERWPAEQTADGVLNNWITTMKGSLVLAPMKTSMGHYLARQAVIDLDPATPGARRVYAIAASTPSWTYLISVDAPATSAEASKYFAAAVTSFRTPARCGTTVCTDLLALDAAVGQPVPLPSLPAPASR